VMMQATKSIFVVIHSQRFMMGLLAILFLVSNVGVPVVLASCPMMKQGSAPTCMECRKQSDRSGPAFTPVIDRSCCQTIIAAERNTTEFLQSHNVHLSSGIGQEACEVSLSLAAGHQTRLPVSFVPAFLSSPPDVLLRTSALLI
jgi:hypothetical protein